MANTVIIGIASASIALALTAFTAKPSSAMSFNDYDASAQPLGSRAEVNDLFSGRLVAGESRRARQAQALNDLREGKTSTSLFDAQPATETLRPISLTLPF